MSYPLLFAAWLALSSTYTLFVLRVAQFLAIAYGPLPVVEFREEGYWCVVCGRFLPADSDGLIVHDNIPHPPTMAFDDENRPQ